MGRGLALARAYYTEVVQPLLSEVPHAAALLGDGSEVLGYDDDISTDHDFGPRLQVFVDDATSTADAEAATDVDAMLTRSLPERFAGFPVAFAVPGLFGGKVHHQVVVTTTSAFFTDLLRFDPAEGVTLADWLLTPTQRLATFTGGEVFHDPHDWVEPRRRELEWYPDDVWRYVLAAAWLRVGQENAFIGRTGASGDHLGSRTVAARVVRDLVRLVFLIERRWAPYSKWLGRAFADLPLAADVGPHLDAALATSSWRDREARLCDASSLVAEATNELGLAPPVDATPRRFHERDIRVVAGEAFTDALCASISDPAIVALLERLGRRWGDGPGRLPGAIDQAVDSTDVLTAPDRCRAAAGLLGLGADGLGS